MANNVELREISKARLKSAEKLMIVEDWLGAAYMMAWSLECALKAVTCKTLHLQNYPEDKRTSDYFMTHRFDRLLIVSGMENVFSSRGDVDTYQNWSDFTGQFQTTDWPNMRYDPNPQWTKSKVENMYTYLKDPQNGIITTIIEKRKW